MKKNLFYLMTILLVSLVSVSFVSCGSDDDEGEISTSPIIGTWKYELLGREAIFTFDKNKTVVLSSNFSGKMKTSNGIFDDSGGAKGVVKITWSNSTTPELISYEIIGNKMTTTGLLTSSGTITWTRQ